ncbi:hypothetical protein AAG594_05425 [Citromicrobium bathyomarinum]
MGRQLSSGEVGFSCSIAEGSSPGRASSCAKAHVEAVKATRDIKRTENLVNKAPSPFRLGCYTNMIIVPKEKHMSRQQSQLSTMPVSQPASWFWQKLYSAPKLP